MSDLNANVQPDPLLEGLTEPQREAVTHVDGPMLILAGAGSGKTRVITRRIAHLVLRVGIAPWNVLAITFTNKAAGEMRERVAQMLTPRQAAAVTVCTFHSLCARLIRMYGSLLELPPGYSIYDTADQTRLMKQALESLEIRAENFPPAKILGTISNAKNELIDPAQFAAGASGFYDKTVARLYAKYQELLRQNRALDFDDLLLYGVKLIREHPDVAAELRQRYQYVLIDEYQDTNHAQFVLAHGLAAEHQNLCVTGDPDQSIYAWRGADIRNIMEFERQYPGARVVRLEQNYRSSKRILAAADRLIRQNVNRKHKQLWTENEAGDPVQIVATDSERSEADYVVDRFQELHLQRGIPWSGFAVFYRTNSLSRVMEETLMRRGMPYQIARGTAFYDRKEVRDAIAYLRVIVNPDDEVNLLRIINTPARGISAATVKSLRAHVETHPVSLWDLLQQPQQVASLNTRAVKAIHRFAQMVRDWQKQLGLDDPQAADKTRDPHALRRFVEYVLRESGLEDHYINDKSDPEGDRIENLGELVSSAQQFESDTEIALDQDVDRLPALHEKLLGFLEQISLVSDVDSVEPGQGSITLMTLHAAKGLEFPVVAMIGVEDGLLPHQRAAEDGRDLEEERRLAFVGMTRAQRTLLITHARMRTVFGQTMPAIASRFLEEIKGEDVEVIDAFQPAADLRYQSESVRQQHHLADLHAAEFPPGTRVRHPTFGFGRVITVTAAGPQARARVAFNTAGVKTLILAYANLEKV